MLQVTRCSAVPNIEARGAVKRFESAFDCITEIAVNRSAATRPVDGYFRDAIKRAFNVSLSALALDHLQPSSSVSFAAKT